MTLHELFSKVDFHEYFLGDAATEKLIKPDDYSTAELSDCKVTCISSKFDTPVIWLDLKGDAHAIGILDT